MRKFLSSIVLLVLSLFAANVSAQTVGETILGTPSISWMKDNWGNDISGQCTFIKFNYPDADESKYYRKKNEGLAAKLYQGTTLVEESTFGYDWDLWQNGAKFNTILDPSKTYRVEFAEGCWYMSSDEEGEEKVEISPAKEFVIEATQGGGEQGGGSQATPWDFTSVTPAVGNVASINKITVKAANIDFSSVTSMTKGVIKCEETGIETNIFFMSTWDGTGLEASFTKIADDGTYTLTIAEGAVTVNGNPNNEFTATWTIGETKKSAEATITIGSDVITLSETTPIELEDYPEGAVIKVYVSDDAIKMARYEILCDETGEALKSFADMVKGDGYYYSEMPRKYGMAAGMHYKIHVWFRNSQSSFSGQTLYEYNYLVNGTNKNVPVLSLVSEFESVSPTEDFVLTGVTGTNTIDVRFKGEAPASATAWATVGQGSRVNLTTTISGQAVKVTVPNSAIAQGVLVLFVQAKDSEGHIIGGGDQSVNPDNGALSFSWLAEVGLEQPRMLEANTTVDELKTVTFMASDILSLDEGQLVTINGAVKRRYQTLQIMDKLGNVIVSEVTADQYEQVGNNITLTLKSGIVEAGEYTIVLPYGAFLIGEEMQAASNASGTYVVTVSGNLEPESDNILGDPVFTVTADQITISFPNAKIPAGITDGEVTLPGGVIVNTPDGTEDTEKYAYPDAVTIPTTDVISFTFNNPCGANAIVTIPAEGIQVVDYTTDYFNGTVIYTNSEALTNNTTSGINAIKAAAVNGAAFNIAGQKVNADAKGIIIVNGKKQVNK